jgi:hypothetical protein
VNSLNAQIGVRFRGKPENFAHCETYRLTGRAARNEVGGFWTQTGHVASDRSITCSLGYLDAEGLGNLGLMASSVIGLISEAVVVADRAGYPLNRTALATVRAEHPIGSTGSDHAIGRHVTSRPYI